MFDGRKHLQHRVSTWRKPPYFSLVSTKEVDIVFDELSNHILAPFVADGKLLDSEVGHTELPSVDLSQTFGVISRLYSQELNDVICNTHYSSP